jgi:hypothetical protein
MPASAGQAEAPTVPCAHTSGGSGREQNELEGARNEEAGAERDRTTEEATEEVNEEEEEGGPRAPGASSPGVWVPEGKSRETRTIVVRLERMTSSARFCRVAAGGEGRRTGQREDERGNEGGTRREGTRADAGGGRARARAPGMHPRTNTAPPRPRPR